MITVEQFYDTFADEYSDSVRRCNPHYDEMIQSVFDALPESLLPEAILELGCGTGNLTRYVAARYPAAHLVANDISAEALEVCRQRVDHAHLTLAKEDMLELSFEADRFDLIISSLALHHLTDSQRSAFFTGVLRWIRPGGWLAYCDRFQSPCEYRHQINTAQRKEFAFRNGATEEEWGRWMQHERDHDTPGLLTDQLNSIQTAGFQRVECTWRKSTWGTIVAEKAQQAGGTVRR